MQLDLSRRPFRTEAGAAWCVALGFCAFTPLCVTLCLKSGVWRPGGKRDNGRDNSTAENCQSDTF